MSASAIYEGEVLHHRREPRTHGFRYRLFMLYVDLDELPTLFRGHWSWKVTRPLFAWFRRADYMGPPDIPLRQAVLDRVEHALGRRPSGAVRMLTHLRTLGHVFNPVTFYYCFDANEELDAVAAEITNTPWGERHTYVLDAHGHAEGGRHWRFAKAFHVSPFHAMRHEYEWRIDDPGEELAIEMCNVEDGRAIFGAGLTCRRRELTGRALASALLRHPLLTVRIHLAIYWQAARLFAKRVPFHPHPRHAADRAKAGAA